MSSTNPFRRARIPSTDTSNGGQNGGGTTSAEPIGADATLVIDTDLARQPKAKVIKTVRIVSPHSAGSEPETGDFPFSSSSGREGRNLSSPPAGPPSSDDGTVDSADNGTREAAALSSFQSMLLGKQPQTGGNVPVASGPAPVPAELVNPFQRTLATIEPSSDSGDATSATVSRPAEDTKAQYDVNTFQRLLLTGQKVQPAKSQTDVQLEATSTGVANLGTKDETAPTRPNAPPAGPRTVSFDDPGLLGYGEDAHIHPHSPYTATKTDSTKRPKPAPPPSRKSGSSRPTSSSSNDPTGSHTALHHPSTLGPSSPNATTFPSPSPSPSAVGTGTSKPIPPPPRPRRSNTYSTSRPGSSSGPAPSRPLSSTLSSPSPPINSSPAPTPLTSTSAASTPPTPPRRRGGSTQTSTTPHYIRPARDRLDSNGPATDATHALPAAVVNGAESTNVLADLDALQREVDALRQQMNQ